MVMSIHDAGVSSPITDTTLIQGLGAVIWATPSGQAKHECVVLALQYSTQIVNDNSEATEDLDATVNLITSLESQYNIDKNRVYATGQSGGCMMSITLFAVLVAIILITWYMSEKTLSIHSIYTRRREAFYWAAAMATFALGTDTGDMTAETSHLGFLFSGFVTSLAVIFCCEVVFSFEGPLLALAPATSYMC